MTLKSLDFSVHLDVDRLEHILAQINSVQSLIIDAATSLTFGQIHFSLSDHFEDANNRSQMLSSVKKCLKRKTCSPVESASERKSKRLIEPIARKDVQTALKDLNLMPDIGADLACAMCPYIATQKGSLKIHYKLKHLGGADLIMTCQICQTKLKTRSYMKKHYMKVHKLLENAAQNMTNSNL